MSYKRLTICVLLLLGSVGCARPCQDLADAACASAGEESAECLKLREKADRADGEMRDACAAALKIRESLSTVR